MANRFILYGLDDDEIEELFIEVMTHMFKLAEDDIVEFEVIRGGANELEAEDDFGIDVDEVYTNPFTEQVFKSMSREFNRRKL